MIWRPVGFQTIAGAAAATALTVPPGAVRALIDVEDNSVRWRDDGTDPTTAVGMLIAAADPLLDYRGNLSTIKFIELASATEINITYFAQGG